MKSGQAPTPAPSFSRRGLGVVKNKKAHRKNFYGLLLLFICNENLLHFYFKLVTNPNLFTALNLYSH